MRRGWRPLAGFTYSRARHSRDTVEGLLRGFVEEIVRLGVPEA